MTATDSLDLAGLATVAQILSRTPTGTDVLGIAQRIGLVSPGINSQVSRPEFQRNIKDLTPAGLSDLQGLWTHEFGRICDLHGLLSGQRDYLNLKLKAERARARGRIRRDLAAREDKAKVTAGELNDLAEEDATVTELNEQLAVVELLMASTAAAKEATDRYLQSISREITFRCTQMEARIY